MTPTMNAPRRRTWCRPIAALLPVLLTAACSSPAARVHAGYMQTELSGDLGLGPIVNTPVQVDPIDIDQSLGLDDAAGSPFVRAELDAGPIRLTGSGFQYSQSGRGVLTGSFGDITAGTAVDSDIDLLNAKTALTFDVRDISPVRISPGIGVDLFDIDATVAPLDQNLGIEAETIDELIPVPMLFLQAEVDVDYVGAILDVGGFQANIDDFEGTFFDIEALVYVRPVDHLEITAGYRYISLDFEGRPEDQDVDADLNLSGWFIGGGVSF